MQALSRHGARIAVSLIPLLLTILHALGVLQLGLLDRLDHILYDARLRATLSATHDERVVIVDIDEKSLAEVGRWPWPRDRLAQLVERLFDQQGIALLGLDTVFAEAEDHAGERTDEQFARALQGRPVVLGYYFTSDRQGHTSGVLPEPVLRAQDLQGRALHATRWTGYGANIAPLAAAAPQAGFFNALADGDGVVRSLPLLAEHQGAFYESLALAMFRRLQGLPRLVPGYGDNAPLWGTQALPRSLRLTHGANAVELPVDERMAMLVPYRGPGGPQGGSFTYVSAADVLSGRLPPGQLRERIVLLGTTVPGLMDLRVTPVGEAYPGVETHANLLSGLLDGRPLVRPDYAPGYELLTLLVSGLVLALGLPLLSAARAVLLSLGVVVALVGLNTWLYLDHGLVLPLAASLVTAGLSFALNMSYGYLVESRAKRELAQLFGTYVPPELVQQMLQDPERYSMAATTREMTVLFCDLKGFTSLAEHMEPTQVQALLNTVFSRLTQVIRRHGGTVDKYMGDCVMAFWGAPVECTDHARRAVDAARDMLTAIQTLNAEHARQGLPAIGAGIGISTGPMCVGDMGSDLRRSYTVVGDAVNLGARLESLTRVYGEDVVVSEATHAACPHLVWQELDRVHVKGKAEAVTVFTPRGLVRTLAPSQLRELDLWHHTLHRWRAQDWEACERQLDQLQPPNEEKVLYRLYAQRVASMRRSPPGPDWDGAMSIDTK
jgi:adenylate cyclase